MLGLLQLLNKRRIDCGVRNVWANQADSPRYTLVALFTGKDTLLDLTMLVGGC